MNIKKVNFKRIASLVLVALLMLSTIMISFAAEPGKVSTSTFEKISDVTQQHFLAFENALQEKLSNTKYVAEEYKSSTYPAAKTRHYETANFAPEMQELTSARANGILDYVAGLDLRLLSWDTLIGEPMDIVISESGEMTCDVYVWTSFEWSHSEIPTPIESGFGTLHTLTLTPEFQIVSDFFDERDISGINTRENLNTESGDILQNNSVFVESGTTCDFVESNERNLVNNERVLINRTDLVTYANQYVGNYDFDSGDVTDYATYNRKYMNCNAGNGDCMNYVSQCLYYAGMRQVANWTYSENGTSCNNASHIANDNDYYSTHACTANDYAGAAWISATGFVNTFTGTNPNPPYATIYDENPEASDFYVGDVGIFRNERLQPYHGVICVGRGSSYFLMNSHNNDRKQVPINDDTISTERIVRIHIHSPSNRWIRIDANSHYSPCNSGCGYNHVGAHYASVPGQNATCISCGYIGYINNGIS